MMVEVATLELTARTDGLLKAEAALDRVTAAAIKTDAAADALAVATEKGSKKSEEGAQNHERMRASIDALRASVDPLYASSIRYSSALDQVNEAVKAGAISQSQAAIVLDRVENAYLGASNSARGFGGALANMRAKGVQGGTGLQNLGYQVQDFAVQVGAGTSATQALGQQLPQLLSGFGLLGVALGTAAAVLVPLAGHFFRSSEGAVSLDDAVGTLSESIGAYEGFVARAATSTTILAEEFGNFAGQIRGFSEFMAGVSLDQSLDDMTAALDPLKGGLAEIEMQLANVARAQEVFNLQSMNADPTQYLLAKDALELFQANLDEAAGSLGLNVEQSQRLLDAMNALSNAKTMEEIAAASLRAQGVMAKIRGEVGSLPVPLRAAATALDQMATEAAKAASAAGDIGRNAPVGSWLDGPIRAAEILTGKLQAAAAAAAFTRAQMQLADQGAVYGKVGARGDPRNITPEGVSEFKYDGPSLDVFNNPIISGSGAGTGSGGAGDGFAGRLEALQEELMTEREVVDAWYAENQTILADRRALEMLGEQGHRDALLDLEAEYQQRLSEIQGEGQNSRLNDTASFFGGMAKLAASGGDKLAKAAQTFGAAEALVNSYVAFTAVLRDPSFIGRPLARIGAAAAVLAQGLGAVRAIKGGGGGGGGSVGSTAIGTAATSAPPQQDRVIRINVEGDGMFSEALRGATRQIADALGQERDIGGFVVA